MLVSFLHACALRPIPPFLQPMHTKWCLSPCRPSSLPPTHPPPHTCSWCETRTRVDPPSSPHTHWSKMWRPTCASTALRGSSSK